MGNATSEIQELSLEKRLRYRAESAAFSSLLWLFKALPLAASYRIAEGVTWTIYAIFRKLRVRAQTHIATCFGDSLSRSDQKQLLRSYIRFHSWFWVDSLIGAQLITQERYRERIEANDLLSLLEREGSAGAILVGSHQGTPDLITLALGVNGYCVGAIARTLDNPFIAKRVESLRSGIPRIEFPKAGGLRPSFAYLKKQGIVGLQIDQDAGPEGIFVPYFGKLASTHAGAGMLAALSKKPVFLTHAIRTSPRTFEYKIFAEEVEIDRGLEDTDAQVYEWTRKLTEKLEPMARRYPEQMFFAHRRWKSQPPKRFQKPMPDNAITLIHRTSLQNASNRKIDEAHHDRENRQEGDVLHK